MRVSTDGEGDWMSSAGFSPWGFDFARTKPHRMKAVILGGHYPASKESLDVECLQRVNESEYVCSPIHLCVCVWRSTTRCRDARFGGALQGPRIMKSIGPWKIAALCLSAVLFVFAPVAVAAQEQSTEQATEQVTEQANEQLATRELATQQGAAQEDSTQDYSTQQQVAQPSSPQEQSPSCYGLGSRPAD